MRTVIVSGPGRYPVTLAEAKLHLNIPSADSNHDDYLKLLIARSSEYAEKFTGRKLIYQTQYLYLDCWPRASYIQMPFGQLQAVASVKYTNVDADETTWDSADYIVRTGDYGLVALAYAKSWPTAVLYPVDPIKIEFTCGYYAGDVWSASKSISKDDIILPTGYSDPFAYQADGDGTTDATNEPSWPQTVGGTVDDNGITWTNIGLAVPCSIRLGILFAIADVFELREPWVIGTIHKSLKRSESMFGPYRIWL